MKIAIAGGTGTVGQKIVAEARRRGHDTSVLARAAGADLITGAGVDAALEGADAVIDAASVGTLSAQAATTFFRTASATLLAGAAKAGVAHAVLLSIVGIDRNPHGYYAGKVAQEQLYREAPVPWTIVRATQFHEFAAQVAGQARLGPLQLAPRARLQPVAAAEVAAHVVDLAEGAPRGRAADIAGPHEEELADMIRAWVRHEGHRGPVVPVRLPSAQMRGMRRGLALPGADALSLGPSFREWLDGEPISAARAPR